MNTKQLRQKILDLAIRGKLVPQDPNDEPASVLLERIRAEKEKLIKAGKIKRDKRGSIIFDDDKSHYGQLPQGWEWVSLSHLAFFSGGKTPTTNNKDFWDGSINWTTSKDMKSKYIDSTMTKMSQLGAEQMQVFPPKTLLMVVRSGILRHTLPLAILRCESTINQDIKSISFYDDCICEFVYSYILANQHYILTKFSKSGTTVESINFDEFKVISIPLPPLIEQHRIATAIELTFSWIDTIEQSKADLAAAVTAAKSKVLSLAIRGKLVPQDPNDEPASVLLERIRAEREKLAKAGKIKRTKGESAIVRGDDNSYYRNVDGKKEHLAEIPPSWEWVVLKDVGVYASGKTPSATELFSTGRYPYFKVADMNTPGNELYLSLTNSYLSDNYNSITFQENSIVFPKNGGAVLTNKKRILTREALVDLNIGVYSPTTILDFWYMFYFFTSIDFRKLFKGAVLPTLDKSVVELMAFPIPPLSEQQRIVVAIEAMFEQLDGMITILT